MNNSPSKNNQHNISATTNTISSVHRGLAAICLIGAVITLIIGLVYKRNDALAWCLPISLGFLFASVPFFTIAELIQILHDIRAKLYETSNKQNSEKKDK